MKELYIAPEVELICFAPMEELAANPYDISLTGDTSSPIIEDSWTGDKEQDGDMFP